MPTRSISSFGNNAYLEVQRLACLVNTVRVHTEWSFQQRHQLSAAPGR